MLLYQAAQIRIHSLHFTCFNLSLQSSALCRFSFKTESIIIKLQSKPISFARFFFLSICTWNCSSSEHQMQHANLYSTTILKLIKLLELGLNAILCIQSMLCGLWLTLFWLDWGLQVWYIWGNLTNSCRGSSKTKCVGRSTLLRRKRK